MAEQRCIISIGGQTLLYALLSRFRAKRLVENAHQVFKTIIRIHIKKARKTKVVPQEAVLKQPQNTHRRIGSIQFSGTQFQAKQGPVPIARWSHSTPWPCCTWDYVAALAVGTCCSSSVVTILSYSICTLQIKKSQRANSRPSV